MSITSVVKLPIWRVDFTKTVDGSSGVRTVISPTSQQAEALFKLEANDLYPDGFTVVSVTDTGRTVPQ